MKCQLSSQDLYFLIDTLMPGTRDLEHAAGVIRGDDRFVEAMLDDDRLFQRMISDDEVLVKVSPWLFFTVLLRRARRDLETETFTVERRSQQKVFLFDTDLVVDLLQQEALQDYLASVLASFTRIESITIPVRVKQGIWHKYRINDLDVGSLMRYSDRVEEPVRFDAYRRIGDVCLFLTGMFPDYIEAQARYPASRRLRLRAKSQLLMSREDYEDYGRAFYRLAAEHRRAETEGLAGVLKNLSENFVLAEKPLTFLTDRYLRLTKHRLFDMS
jgi:hypothetical protein